MRKLRTALIAGVVTLGIAGAAVAAAERVHVMNVNLPDGGVAQIHYIGDVAPRIQVVNAPSASVQMAVPAGFGALELEHVAQDDPFVQMDMMMAQMEQRHNAMMQHFAQMEQAAAAASRANGRQTMQVAQQGSQPQQGSVVKYSFYSSTSGQNGCTQTVEWRSDGSAKEPEVVRASSGDCDSVERSREATPAAEVVRPTVPAKPKPAADKDQSHLLPGRST